VVVPAAAITPFSAASADDAADIVSVIAVVAAAGAGGLGGVKKGCGAGNVIGNLGNNGGSLLVLSVLGFN
jgi:hypothetical protein